ncbi:hypothetical protein CEXT_264941 [Caerostris extrusa]|uniref:Uncharacterized protein n=1 Tax=Caerostris extrusa TaxID=172846 RepID=A0AAV4WY71_CAEEX|nr:hypothetical protein CEXT_264941 [Caerostris extrusa]
MVSDQSGRTLAISASLSAAGGYSRFWDEFAPCSRFRPVAFPSLLLLQMVIESGHLRNAWWRASLPPLVSLHYSSSKWLSRMIISGTPDSGRHGDDRR